MDTKELERLSRWYIEEYNVLSQLYRQILVPIQHNSTQQNKQPLEEPLETLLSFLRRMSFDHLSIQQLKLLSHLNIDKYIGHEGANFVEKTIRTSEYDPTTAASIIQVAAAKLGSAQAGFSQYLSALDALEMRSPELSDDSEIVIRVGFQEEASINNVADWRNSAEDWYGIIRGISMVAGEAPEDTKIVGADTGSIILLLVGTATVTGLLALICKHVVNAAMKTVELQNQIEDLRHKKFLNKTIETELKKQIESTQNGALESIVDLVKRSIENLDGEKISALTSSIQKLLTFSEKGGNVDFVAPDDGAEDDAGAEDLDEKAESSFGDAQRLIREYQAAREKLKLLTHQAAD